MIIPSLSKSSDHDAVNAVNDANDVNDDHVKCYLISSLAIRRCTILHAKHVY